MKVQDILTVRSTMIERAEGKETLLVDGAEVRALVDYIDRLDKRMQDKERELRMAEDDLDFCNRQLKVYEENIICRLVMTVISKARQFKEWRRNRQRVKYQFKLQGTEE